MELQRHEIEKLLLCSAAAFLVTFIVMVAAYSLLFAA